MNKIGALWAKKSKAGETYMSGVFQDMRGDFKVVAFKNTKKEKENQPDYLVYVSDDKEEKKSQVVDILDDVAGEKSIEELQQTDEININEIDFG